MRATTDNTFLVSPSFCADVSFGGVCGPLWLRQRFSIASLREYAHGFSQTVPMVSLRLSLVIDASS